MALRRGRPATTTVACILTGLLGAGLLLGACGSDGSASRSSTTSTARATTPSTTSPSTARRPHAIALTTDTFIDSSRRTKANGDHRAQPHRDLETTVVYPSDGARGQRFPLVVFAHGLGASPAVYRGLADAWATAGYVVALPRFPLTTTTAAGGIDPGDVVNQPQDVSFVITSILKASRARRGPLAGLVDPKAVGVAGHSLGGITALGVAANTCCADPRVKAAVALAGDPLPFPGGRWDYAHAPPLLLVHGTDDELVTYQASVDVFNRARPPKGIVTISGGGHGDPVSPEAPAFPQVVRATTDFFDGYLKGDAAALADLAETGGGTVTVRFVRTPGAKVTLPTTTTAARTRRASATPRTNLRDGQPVTVEWSGFTPGATINIVQCASADAGAAACDLKHGLILRPNPTGSGSLALAIVVGPVGDGTCDAAHRGCVIVVNDGGSLDRSASVRIPLTFAKT
jgi:fermentation-respiration switch protein FrsA (DUF1100 family)